MRTPLHTSLAGASAALLATFLPPAGAFASDEPVNTRPPMTAIVQQVESLRAPATDVMAEPDDRRLDTNSLHATQIPADGAQRGAVMTDASVGLPAGPLTALESAKLDAARAAVERSRAAGTLFVTRLPETTVPANLDEMAAMKMQRLAAQHSVAPTPDPIVGVGQDLKAVQLPGPAGLSPVEEAKLRGELPAPATLPVPVPTLKPGENAHGDGAPSPVTAPVQKETRDE